MRRVQRVASLDTDVPAAPVVSKVGIRVFQPAEPRPRQHTLETIWIDCRDADERTERDALAISTTSIEGTVVRARIEARIVKGQAVVCFVAHAQVVWDDGETNKAAMMIVPRPQDLHKLSSAVGQRCDVLLVLPA